MYLLFDGFFPAILPPACSRRKVFSKQYFDIRASQMTTKINKKSGALVERVYAFLIKIYIPQDLEFQNLSAQFCFLPQFIK
jgi:hypothetical protein